MAQIRIIETGEILDFAPNSLVAVHRPGTPDYEEQEYPISEVEIIPDVGSHEQERLEFAKMAMHAFIIKGLCSEAIIIENSIRLADKMIKQLYDDGNRT